MSKKLQEYEVDITKSYYVIAESEKEAIEILTNRLQLKPRSYLSLFFKILLIAFSAYLIQHFLVQFFIIEPICK